MDKGGIFLLRVTYSDLGSMYFSQLSDFQIDEIYSYIKKNERIQEAVVLWTCNRLEIYFYPGDRETVQYLEDYIKEKVAKYSVIHGWDAIKHIFMVSAGLDSMVLGENEILGQVKEAWEQSKKNLLSGTNMNLVFQKAIETGKKVRRENAFNGIKRSVVSEALELANLSKEDRILVVGAGRVGRQIAKMLHDRNIEFAIANRTEARAMELADSFGGRTESFDQRRWKGYDVVITAVKAHKLVLDSSFPKDSRVSSIIDLGTPPNIDPSIKNKLKVIDMEFLSRKIEEKKEERQSLANQALRTVEREFNKFSSKVKNDEKSEILRKIHEYSDLVIQDEVREIERRMELSQEEKVILEKGLIATRNRLLGIVINAIKTSDDIMTSNVISKMELLMNENFSRFKAKKIKEIT
ncbi:MAG: NAD(P)-binding domain-containing protein [Candidatus Thermoplasmatota archaeon]|nr:NAD(P)-binding domain-containing protein [Candidatus Thermoplasmatota archaeon]